MAKHDGSYELLFSHPRMVQDLLRGFVHAQWIAELDFSSLERVGTHYISENLRRRESDVVWRVRWTRDGQTRFVYLLMEFQSSPDRFMALRLQTYVALLHQDLVRRKQLSDGRKLPAVLPLVLYNGARRWSAPGEMSVLVEQEPGELRHYSPQLRYLLVDERALPEGALPGAENLVGALIRLERSDCPEEMLEVAGQLERELRAPGLSELRRHFAVWINTVWAGSRFPGVAIPAVKDLEEGWSMLAERMVQWTKQWERKGLREGLRKGEATIVRRMLTHRYGRLPRHVIERIERARPKELERWSKRLLEADTLDAVFEK
jgi:hypothetical protein